ncbi:sulfur carrier protein [Arcicella aurantiaca]|uniref:Sulfur carrier protein n=1 Tax=Arcicella aurantiaca TaxID=591202 RepID=A0A316ELI2_9BACT|nr:sulfur carrier protein ThiS [Arcicella aurantiaca]PWK23820.1 sulfur carrier protein [Arcicella aurantiaca]
MTIFINDQPTDFDPPPTIVDIFEKLQISDLQGIALAINDEVVKKADWQQITLNQNDRLMLIRATQGG